MLEALSPMLDALSPKGDGGAQRQQWVEEIENGVVSCLTQVLSHSSNLDDPNRLPVLSPP